MEYVEDRNLARFGYHLRKGDCNVRGKFDKLGVTRFHLPQEDYPVLAKAASVVRTPLAEGSGRGRQIVKLRTDRMRRTGCIDHDLGEA